jgi:hypothetical protein
MLFVFYGWLLFRAGSWQRIISLTGSLADFTLPTGATHYCLNLVVFTLPLILMQLWQHRVNDLLVPLRWPRFGKVLLQGALLVGIVVFWNQDQVPFIYFQF